MRILGIVFLVGGLLLNALGAKSGTRNYLGRSDRWFDGNEAEQIAENILSWQSELGGWPKNIDVSADAYDGDRSELHPTFDNRATTDELRFLARIYTETHEKRYKEAFERGYDYILKAQYPTGGWPQYYPPSPKYHRYITFNDGAMVRLMFFLKETYENEDEHYDFIDRHRTSAAKKAFDDGIECILNCQVKVDDKLTVWCAQHDEMNYEARPGRAFELVSLSGFESVEIVELLMSLEDPSDEVVAAVDAALEWFRASSLHGIKVTWVDENKVVVKDDDAPLLWARFYEIETNRPFFCGRDGMKKYDIAEIDAERRNGYSWYGSWPQRLIEKEYPAWKKRID